MSLLDELRARREEILALAATHGVISLRVFGSALRGEEKPGSDVDFLISMEQGRDYFDLVELQLALEAMLGRACDVVSEGGLHRLLRDAIMREACPL